VQNLPFFKFQRRQLAEDCGIFTCLIFPILKEKKITGIFEFYSNKETEEDYEILTIIEEILK